MSVIDAKAFPLMWPIGWKRTDATARQPARFGSTVTTTGTSGSWRRRGTLSVAEALKRLLLELHRLGVSSDDYVISTNMPLRLDGHPRSDRLAPLDPGVAVYFRLEGKDRVLACDRWDRVPDNLAAVAAHIDAMRGMLRWGVGDLNQAFTGYDALPPPREPEHREWREVLRPGAPTARGWTPEIAEAAYKVLLRERHPDRGGAHEQALELNRAIQEARKEFGA